MADPPLERALDAIRRDEVVAAPTDTLIGLLARARSADAVRRVLAIKGPERHGPVPVLVPSLEAAIALAESFPEAARRRAERAWPGPLTVVVRARPGLPRELLAGGSTVGLRVPGCSPALELVRAAGEPLTGTSANRAGMGAPMDSAALDPAVARAVAFVWPGAARLGLASAVVDYSSGEERVLRPGPVLD